MLSFSTVMWILMIATVVVGVPFTLWWWKMADKWADAEHRRFKPRPDRRERIVVKRPPDADGGTP
jgi:hypothetical protein